MELHHILLTSDSDIINSGPNSSSYKNSVILYLGIIPKGLGLISSSVKAFAKSRPDKSTFLMETKEGRVGIRESITCSIVMVFAI